MGFLLRDPRIDLLRNVKLFSFCSAAELRRLASISTIVDVDTGRVMVREDEFGRDFFVIVEGRATVTLRGELLATVGPGDFFGEMALLNGSTRVATVTATEPMSLISFSALEFTTLLGSLPPSVARRMLAGVTARLRDADHRAVPMTADRVGQQPVDVGARSSPAS